jgi:hypothetical protein
VRRTLALVTVISVGCAGSTATIYRPDGPPYEAEIDSSDASTLRLRGPSGNVTGLGQYQVSDIDHPGNALAIGGLVFAGVSSLLLLPVLLPRRPQDGPGDGFVGLAAVMGIGGIIEGLAVAAYNGVVWSRSKARARNFEEGRPPDWLIPPPAPGEPWIIDPLPHAPETPAPDPATTPGGTFQR